MEARALECSRPNVSSSIDARAILDKLIAGFLSVEGRHLRANIGGDTRACFAKEGAEAKAGSLLILPRSLDDHVTLDIRTCA